jgi:hypothetical protein
MVMYQQAQRLSEPLRWERRQKAALAFAVSVFAAGALAIGIYAATNSTPARADCIRVTFASTLGGADLRGCGGKARRICASGSFPNLTDQLASACKRAGFPFKRPS